MLIARAALAAIILTGGAHAAVTTIGSNGGRACYEAAEWKRDVKAGLGVCSKALDDEPLSQRDRAATHINRGILHMSARDFASAIADYDSALRIDPGLAEAYVNRGIALVHMGGRDREAIENLNRGLQLNPSRPEVALYTRGVAYEIAGDLRQAFEDYSAAAAIKPDWADPVEQLKRFNVERRKTGRG